LPQSTALGAAVIDDRLLKIIEALGVAATLAFIGLWIYDPSKNWEAYAALSGGISLICDLYRRFWPADKSARFGSPNVQMNHRESLRKAVKDEIYKCRAENLRQDAIIRDVSRVDSYPNTDDKARGVSPWFRIGLVDAYDKGIVVCLRIGGLKEVEGGYLFVDYVNDEPSDTTAWLMGNIPFDSIAEINFDGDEYYYFPHIYCHFDFNGEPYEKLWFAHKIDQPHGHPYFKELATYDEVKRNNPMDGDLSFY
jgi:hypothetical protein